MFLRKQTCIVLDHASLSGLFKCPSLVMGGLLIFQGHPLVHSNTTQTLHGTAIFAYIGVVWGVNVINLQYIVLPETAK